jgi:TolB protein
VPGFDDRLTRELEHVGRPEPAPPGLIREVDRRRGRRAFVRRAQAAALAIVVLVGTGGGVVALNHVFRTGGPSPGDTDTPLVLAPTNGLIVMSVADDGGSHLYVWDPAHPEIDPREHILTPSDGVAVHDTSPSISPDGTMVVFAREELGVLEPLPSAIYVVGIDGSGLTRLTGPAWVAVDPAWSPDGTSIAFAGSSPGGPSGIFVMSADGSSPHLVPGTDDTEVAGPTWSPDGSRIAFAAPNDIDWDIESVALDGSDLSLVTSTNDTSETAPAWSPDGSRIAFARDGGIYTIAPDGTNEVHVHGGGDPEAVDANPSWSPDGELILFDLTQSPSEIFVEQVAPDGSGLAKLTVGAEPSWQPVPEGGPSPNPSAEPTNEPTEESGRDIGLDFLVCFPNWLGGIDYTGDGTHGSAWTGVPVKEDGSCPKYAKPSKYILAVDYTGDRLADSWLDLPFECSVGCAPFDATDLDGDGSEELVVTSIFSIMDYYLFAVRQTPAGGLHVEPILVASPGHEPAGITAGLPLRIDAGGDAGYGSSIQCEGYPSAPVIVWSWSDGPIETDIPKEVHVTRIQLQADGLFHVIGTNDYMVPAGEPTGIDHETGPACGVDW